jgi:hypothetical protein
VRHDGTYEMRSKIRSDNLNGRGLFRDLSIDVRIILK